MNLLLRLANETFLALPTNNCINVVKRQLDYSDLIENAESSVELPEPDAQVRTSSHEYDACFVGWRQAKIIYNEPQTNPFSHQMKSTDRSANLLSSTKNNEQLLLADLLDPSKFDSENILNRLAQMTREFFSIDGHLGSHILDDNCTLNDSTHDGADQTSGSSDPQNWTRLAHMCLDISLSLLGILINLFIILVTFFNARQKRGPVVRGTNHQSGQNNFLLFQLTITGLILASYILFSNMQVHYQTDNRLASTTSTSHQLMTLLDLRLRHYSMAHLRIAKYSTISPMATFLPTIELETQNEWPTRVGTHGDAATNSNIHDVGDEDVEIITPISDQTNLNPQHTLDDYVLMMNFTPSTKIESRTNKPINLHNHHASCLVNSKLDNITGTISCTGVLNSVFIAQYGCAHKMGKLETETSHTVQNPFKEDSVSVREFVLNNFKGTLRNLPSHFMNVIASVHIWTVAALAYDRYCVIAYPLRYLRSIHASRLRTFLLLLWSISFIVNFIIPVTLSIQLEQINNEGLKSMETHGSRDINSPVVSSGINQISKLSQDRLLLTPIDGPEFEKECSFSPIQPVLDGTNEPFSDFSPGEREKRTNYAPGARFGNYQNRENIIDVDARISFRDSFLIRFISFLIELAQESINHSDTMNDDVRQRVTINQKFHVLLLLIHSVLCFVVIIMVPLLVVSVCNINIYKIVKVHERRLSIGSGSNVATSASNLYSNRSFLEKRDSMDDRNSGSKNKKSSSTIFEFFRESLTKMPRFGANSPTKTNDNETSEFCSSGRNLDCDSENASESGWATKNLVENSKIVNRSKKVLARQDSLQLMAKVNGESRDIKTNEQRPEPESTELEDDINKSTTMPRKKDLFNISKKTLYMRKTKIKRKFSDFGLSSEAYRRSSYASELYNRDETCSLHESSMNSDLDHNCNNSSGIINHLKLAGLSFAGIAIQDVPSHGHHKQIHGSSSSSLNNLNSTTPQLSRNQPGNNQCSSSLSRSSIETSSTMTNSPKKSYVSLNAAFRQADYTARYSTKLLDSDPEQLSQHHFGLSLHQTRLPLTIGTKSPTFNVIVWLVSTILLLTLPHFILITIDLIIEINGLGERHHIWDSRSAISEQLVSSVTRMIFSHRTDKSLKNGCDTNNRGSSINSIESLSQYYVQTGFIWLSNLCRLLFLIMLSLNGWLYGIRAQSLKSNFTLVLKRYINRRQASIEINQRQRSSSLMRSRDSSFVNLPPLYYYTPCNACHHRNCLMNNDCNDGKLRRGSSFNSSRRGSNSMNQQNASYQSTSKAEVNSRKGSINSSISGPVTYAFKLKPKPHISNTIRFLIGERSNTHDPINISLEKSYQTQYLQSQSLTSSLAGSSRSLISHMMQSTQSNQCSYEQKPLIASSASDRHRLAPSPIKSILSMDKEDTIKRNNEAGTGCGLSAKPCQDGNTNSDLIFPSNLSEDELEFLKKRHFHEKNLQSSLIIEMDSNDENNDNKSTREIPEQFKLLVTTDDQDYVPTPVSDYNDDMIGDEEMFRLPNSDTDEFSSKTACVNELDPQVDGSALDSWCKELKQSLTRLLLDASSKLAPKIICSPRSERSNSRGTYEDTFRDPSSVVPLRNNSIDKLASWRQAFRIDSSGRSTPKRIRTSSTVDNLKSVKDDNLMRNSQCSGSRCSSKNFCEFHSGRAILINQSPTHLKPPNSLKLMFDSSGHPITYQGPSALSPIKECSSNHSYSSSQSSLSNLATQAKRVEVPVGQPDSLSAV